MVLLSWTRSNPISVRNHKPHLTTMTTCAIGHCSPPIDDTKPAIENPNPIRISKNVLYANDDRTYLEKLDERLKAICNSDNLQIAGCASEIFDFFEINEWIPDLLIVNEELDGRNSGFTNAERDNDLRTGQLVYEELRKTHILRTLPIILLTNRAEEYEKMKRKHAEDKFFRAIFIRTDNDAGREAFVQEVVSAMMELLN